MQYDWSRVFLITTQQVDFSQSCGFDRFSNVVYHLKQKIALMGQTFLGNLYCRYFSEHLGHA